MPPLRRALLFAVNTLWSVVCRIQYLSTYARQALELLRLRLFWLKPRPEDIFIATYPKAGTTWMQMILYQLATGGRGEFEHILQVSPFFEALCDIGKGEAILDSLPSPRLLKTHLPWRWLRLPGQSRCIYVTRNAYDSLISSYHHACLTSGLNLGLEEYFKASLKGATMFGSWFRHLASWWPHRSDPNVLHVRYEDLKRDLEGQIRRIASFCNLPIADGAMPLILEKCSFRYMKQLNARFDVRTPLYERIPPESGEFIRKGGEGAGAQVSAELKAQLEQQVAQLRQRLNIGEAEL